LRRPFFACRPRSDDQKIVVVAHAARSLSLSLDVFGARLAMTRTPNDGLRPPRGGAARRALRPTVFPALVWPRVRRAAGWRMLTHPTMHVCRRVFVVAALLGLVACPHRDKDKDNANKSTPATSVASAPAASSAEPKPDAPASKLAIVPRVKAELDGRADG